MSGFQHTETTATVGMTTAAAVTTASLGTPSAVAAHLPVIGGTTTTTSSPLTAQITS